MKSINMITIFALSLFLLISGCANTKETNNDNNKVDKQRIEIKIAHASSEDSATQVVCKSFAIRAKDLLGDKVEVRVYPNATLGSEAEMVESLQMGTLDAGTFGRHSAIDKKLDVINLPFLFRDDEHVAKVLRGEEGKEVRNKINSMIEKKNIIVIGWYETGFREITSNRKIANTDDLKGLLIRTPSTDTLLKSFKIWGASPTAVDLSELYTSLQSGVVDAQENPYQLIASNKLYEVQKYLCVTDHLTIPNQIVFSKKIWDNYPDYVKKALLEAGKVASDAGAKYNNERNNSLLNELSKKMTVSKMDPDSIEQMRKDAYEHVWPVFVNDSDTKDIVSKIQEIR